MKGILNIDSKDQEYAFYTLSDGDDYVSFLLTRPKEKWRLIKFISGSAGNSNYRADWMNQELYEKTGRGRESRASKEKIKELYSIAIEEIFLLQK